MKINKQTAKEEVAFPAFTWKAFGAGIVLGFIGGYLIAYGLGFVFGVLFGNLVPAGEIVAKAAIVAIIVYESLAFGLLLYALENKTTFIRAIYVGATGVLGGLISIYALTWAKSRGTGTFFIIAFLILLVSTAIGIAEVINSLP